jgi:hypothetical protein
MKEHEHPYWGEGTKVQVNAPGYSNHGKKGTIVFSAPSGQFHAVAFNKKDREKGSGHSYSQADLKHLGNE